LAEINHITVRSHRAVERGKATGQWICYAIDGQRYRTLGSRVSRRFPPLREMSWISNLIVMVVARRIVFHMPWCKKKCDLEPKSWTIWPLAILCHLHATNHYSASCPQSRCQVGPAISPQFPATCKRDETRGDVSIRGLRCGDCIIDVRVTDTDAKSNLPRP
jgi:hypothetical protein